MNRFKALRYGLGLNQTELVAGVDVSRGTLWAIENGTMPSAPVAAKLAKFYGTTVQRLLDEDVAIADLLAEHEAKAADDATASAA